MCTFVKVSLYQVIFAAIGLNGQISTQTFSEETNIHRTNLFCGNR